MNINPLELLKSAQKIQDTMGGIQKKMENVVVTGSAGAGMVEVDLNGRMDVLDVRIEASLVAPDNAEMLEELIAAAVNDGIEKARSAMNSEMGSIVSNLGGALAAGGA